MAEVQAVSLAGAPASTRALPEKRFFFVMAVICAVTVFAGFVPSYYLKDVFHIPPPLSAMTRLHGAVFTAWVLVFVTQAGLINYARPALHRRLGLLAVLLFGAAVAIGVMTAVNAGRLGHAPPGSPPPLVFMVVPLSGITGAAFLVGAALWNRADRAFHMRAMLSAFISMTPPATHRLAIGAGQAPYAIFVSMGIMDALLIVAILYDYRTRKTVNPAYLLAAVVYLAVQGAVAWAYNDQGAWLPFARWVIQT
jgi:hypothetical protein